MPIEIRGIRRAQLRAWLEAVETSFFEELRDDRFGDFSRLVDHRRVLAAFDGKRIVGGGGTFSFQLTVPGPRRVAAAGVTAVGVLPTHRRQGMLRALMARQLADIRASGEPLAILWASEGSIYQRFGYGLAALDGRIEIERERTAFRLPDQPTGSVRLIDLDEAVTAFAPLHDQVAAVTPGFLARDATWWRHQSLTDYAWDRHGETAPYRALLERSGQPAGYAIYRIRSEWTTLGSNTAARVQELIGIDAAAERDLWRFVFGIDLVARITQFHGPARHPLLLMLAEPRRLGLVVRDGLWLRIVDVPAALAARGYADDGRLVLQVNDEFMPAAGGRFVLTARGGEGSATATDEPAELEVDTTDLAAAYLGTFSFSDLARAGRTVEHAAGARGRADALFASAVAAWSPEVF